jgi:hypothetical protein
MNQPSSFSDAEQATLRAVLNRIIPAGDGAPAAGDHGVVDWLERIISERGLERRGFLAGVRAIERTAWQTTDHNFGELASEQQDAILQAVESELPEFFDQLVRLTYRGYYGDANVKAALGLEHRAPQPSGFTLPPFSAELLDPVRARGPVYRKVEQ